MKILITTNNTCSIKSIKQFLSCWKTTQKQKSSTCWHSKVEFFNYTKIKIVSSIKICFYLYPSFCRYMSSAPSKFNKNNNKKKLLDDGTTTRRWQVHGTLSIPTHHVTTQQTLTITISLRYQSPIHSR